jgi:hypothetical protein
MSRIMEAPHDRDLELEEARLFERGLAEAGTVYGELALTLGEYLEGATFVLPNNEHFPDAIELSPEGLETLLRRVISYTPLSEDDPLSLQFIRPEEQEDGKSCSSGACGPAATPGNVRGLLGRDGNGDWIVPVHVQDAANPVRITAHFAWMAGAMLLATADANPPRMSAQEYEVRAEIAAVACGFAPLLMAASHVGLKGCSGVRVHHGTALPTDVLAGLAVLFAAHHNDARGLRQMKGLLEATQQEALDRAVAFFAKRPSFSARFRADPSSIALHCDFGPEEGLFSRLFGSSASSEVAAPVAFARR